MRDRIYYILFQSLNLCFRLPLAYLISKSDMVLNHTFPWVLLCIEIQHFKKYHTWYSSFQFTVPSSPFEGFPKLTPTWCWTKHACIPLVLTTKVHSVIQYIVGIYHVLNTVLGPEVTYMNKRIPLLWTFICMLLYKIESFNLDMEHVFLISISRLDTVFSGTYIEYPKVPCTILFK